MKEKRALKFEAVPKLPKDLGIWSEDRDDERMSMMSFNRQFNVDGTSVKKNNAIKISSQRKIDIVLDGLLQIDNFFYGNVSVIFDVLRGMPAILFNKYALVQHSRKRTMLVQYQMTVTLSYKLAAMANFMDDEFGFRTTAFKEWVLNNLPNILPFLKSGGKENTMVECGDPRCALLFETPEEALKAFSKFDNVRMFDIHEKGKGIWDRQELYSVFKSDVDNEKQEWANDNSLYTFFSKELCERFEACKYGQNISDKSEDK